MPEEISDSNGSWWARLTERYRRQFADEQFVHSLIVGVALLVLSLVVNYLASLYAFERASNSVTDIVLSNIPTFDVEWIFVWGPLIFWLITSIIILHDPKQIPFSLKSIALFIIIRSCFITLTHIGPSPDQIVLDSINTDWLANLLHIKPVFAFIFSSGDDLFFSAHTGLPFLMAMVLWNKPLVRIFCLASSIFFGIIVLLGHLHYSIDVASAFFITYSIYHIAERFFPADQKLFLA